MLYQDRQIGKSGIWAQFTARLSASFSGRRHADLDLLALSPHLRRDLGIDSIARHFSDGEIWRK